jgi:hypothetical protein
MSCYLTNDQKQTARFLVEKIREEELPESFMVHDQRFASIFDLAGRPRNWQEQKRMTGGHFDALEKYELLIVTKRDGSIRHCTVTGLLYKMVDSNFAEEPLLLPTSTSTHPNPPEISMSLDRLRSRYPDLNVSLKSKAEAPEGGFERGDVGQGQRPFAFGPA